MRVAMRFCVLALTAFAAWGMVNIYVPMAPLPHGKVWAWVGIVGELVIAAIVWSLDDFYGRSLK